MLYRLEQLLGSSIEATDGEIGRIEDVYFDDHRWAVRYLAIDTGGWLAEREVLISPISVTGIDWDKRHVRVGLSKRQIEDSPPIDADKPVSRQREMIYFDFFRYSYYWGGAALWGTTPHPESQTLARTHNGGGRSEPHDVSPADPHLRSCNELVGYRLQATDEAIGHLEGFLLDDVTWAIRYLVVDTRNWWPDKHVVIPPQWIQEVDWSTRVVSVNVKRQTLRNAPEYGPTSDLARIPDNEVW